MRKPLLFLSSAVLLFGVGMNISNAINDYGLATNSLHSEILAQANGDDGTGDNTGGGDKTGENGPTPTPNPDIRNGSHMETTQGRDVVSSDAEGIVYYKGQQVGGTYLPNVKYEVNLEIKKCQPDNDGNVCDTSKEGTTATSVGGAVTGGTGTGTGDGNTPTVPTNP